MLLKLYRVVKGALGFKGVLVLLRQFRTLHASLEGTSQFVVDPGFFGTHAGFAFLGRHEEVKQRYQRRIHGGQERLFLNATEAAVAEVFPDDRSVFLFDETVVIFLVVTAAGEGDIFLFAPDFGGIHCRCRCGTPKSGKGRSF